MRHDLRVKDNWALNQLIQEVDKAVVVYIFDENEEIVNEFGYSSLGQHRKTFIEGCLKDVAHHLKEINVEFYCLSSHQRSETIASLLDYWYCTHLSYEHCSGYTEILEMMQLKNVYKQLNYIEHYSNYLFAPTELPFELVDMPDVFSPFRRKVEKNLNVNLQMLLNGQNRKTHGAPQLKLPLPQGMKEVSVVKKEPNYQDSVCHELRYEAGESGALNRIDQYFFNTHGIASYKETRNGLDGWDFSSRLSAYLSVGAISPRTVVRKLKEYEELHLANESTYWLFFELLWREFFHWQAVKHGKRLFRFAGIQNKKPNTSYNSRHFQQWVKGSTAYPIVNACMIQLAQTGFMSNRGRQLVASCFVHELGLDWRYGAAYFEHMLIDYDVASNYGNWQYLAGVGSDPRGHRQFNIEKQTQIYDPENQFITKWLARE